MGGGKNPWEQLSSGGIRTCGLEIASLKWFLLFFPPLCFLPHIHLLWKSQSPLSRGTVGVTCCHFKGKMEKCLKKDGKMSGGQHLSCLGWWGTTEEWEQWANWEHLRRKRMLRPTGTEDFPGPTPIFHLETLLPGQILEDLCFILLGKHNSEIFYQNIVVTSWVRLPPILTLSKDTPSRRWGFWNVCAQNPLPTSTT